MKNLLITIIALLVSSSALCGEHMTGDEITKSFVNKTYDVHNLELDKHLRVYNDGNGYIYVDVPWKNKVFKRKWWVKDNQTCNHHPKFGDLCFDVKDVGGGIYHLFSNGKHVRISSNPRDGRDKNM